MAETVSSAFLSPARLLTEIVFAVRSIRFTSPPSTFPGPTSTKILTPSSTRPLAACVNRTGAVSCSTKSDAKR